MCQRDETLETSMMCNNRRAFRGIAGLVTSLLGCWQPVRIKRVTVRAYVDTRITPVQAGNDDRGNKRKMEIIGVVQPTGNSRPDIATVCEYRSFVSFYDDNGA